VGIYEVIPITPAIRQQILKDSSETTFRKQFQDNLVTMIDDGILKFTEGLTTLEEVMRVTKE
jgi:general secretion pathway protein E